MKTIYLLLVPFFAFANFEIIPNQVSPSNISSTAVSVRATMNSDGSVSGDIYLWYGEGDSLSSFQYIGISAPAGPGITINGVTIGASLSDLSPNTQYSFRWIVANSTGSMIYFSDQTTFITGSSSNSTPTDIFISSSEISEDSEVGSVVGSLSTSDIDSGDQFTYSLVSGDGDSGNSNFSIEGNNLLTASTLDAEITPSYSIRIQTDDGNGGVFSKSFNISITTGEDPSDNSLPTYVPTNGLVAYYPFNGSANDETGNGYDGIINGAVLTSDRFGNNEKAYNYNGTDTFITLPNDFFNGAENGSYTINLWTKHVSTQVPIFKKGGSWKESFVYISPDDKVQYSFYNGTNSDLNVLESNISLDLNNWYNICITHADDEIKLYINGILDSQLQTSNVVDWSTSINTPCSGSGMYIGKDFNNCSIDRGFYGVIDDFGIWNRALTQQEVTNLFNSDTTLSTTDFLNSIIMYPNPVKNMLTIDGFVVKDFVIYSVLGKVVLKMSNQNTIDVSSLSKGVYFIKVSDGINGSTKKFIKE